MRYYFYYQELSKSQDIKKILTVYLLTQKKDIENIGDFFNPHLDLQNPEMFSKQIKLSYNQDLWSIGLNQLGEDIWVREAEALNKLAALTIRTNTLKTDTQSLQKNLQTLNIESQRITDVPEALIITNKTFLSKNEWFEKGHYEFQDLSSQRVAHFISKEILKSSTRIIDACTGAGGKSLHLSALKNNTGQIIALDIEAKKLHELSKRAARLGCNNILIKHIENNKTIKRLEQTADIVLLDVPCSGTGVIKRNPDTKLKFSLKNLSELNQMQQSILDSYSCMLKQGGHLLYVTCSILPCENEQQINYFLKTHNNFELLKQQTLYPSMGFDGFYMALLKRK